MRFQDINELLSDVSEIIDVLESKKESAKSDVSILEISKPKVKSALEHLRSCLEYSAHDVYDIVYSSNDGKTEEQRSKMKLYFPYGKILNDFHSSLGRSFPNLITRNNDIYNLLKSIQPFSSNSAWLCELCEITNKIKHKEQQEQKRIGMRSFNLGGNGGITIEHELGSKNLTYVSGNIINGVKQQNDTVIFGGNVVSRTSNKDTWAVVDWTEFIFKNTNTNVVVLIKDSHTRVGKFIDSLYLTLADYSNAL